MQVYRLSPTLWQRRSGDPQQSAWTVYGIDRPPAGPLAAYVCCEPRPRCDPAATWDGATWFRLRLPQGAGAACADNGSGDGVTWAKLPALLSWMLANGYSLTQDVRLDQLAPGRDVWVSYGA
jgi:hypothetical protein